VWVFRGWRRKRDGGTAGLKTKAYTADVLP
jgi:hypothetical protein